ncbi:sporulation protein YqfD [Sediminibacillus massiliensis]|uniref:sporulation protein YqfD n=1 Tax=Sediminibacillus massiliensis TaxID=1926277 RepID=UPI0009884E97|nr:sporulation protein YqfD [Sediminibacillus massiliensis]
MKQTQSVFFTGYVTIKVTGHHPELFFDLCAREGITVWNVKKISETACIGNVSLNELSTIRILRRKTVYKLAFIRRNGLPFLINRTLRKKQMVAGILLSAMFIAFLSNIVWDVQVEGVPMEIENKIMESLDEHGIHRGAMKFSIDTPGEIQKKLLDDIPELLWVGVTEKGTTYQLEGVEKTIIEEKEEQGPRNIVASKKGVIVDMFVAKGQPKVKVNDVVKKGDLLVSGILGEEDEEQELVTAEGEIIAETWYESNINIPLEAKYDVLTGSREKKYYLKMGKWDIPIWGFKYPDFGEVYRETTEKPFYFLNWTLPLSLVTESIQEKETIQVKRNKQTAIETAIEQASRELQEKLGKEAEISFQKVLHERIESGKVKLILYFKVKENIAKIQPISQGD